jgi:YHS domain-containing protein
MQRFIHPLTWALLAAAGAAVIVATGVSAQSSKTPYNATRGVALDGYDVVAYFTEGRPVKGVAAHTYTWQGTTWRFSSATNREAFAKAPEQYAPQFGGFCAYGVSRGYAVNVDPDAWSIVDGRLYLNYSKSVQRTWDKDRAGYIKKAESNWPTVAAKQAGQE